MVSLGSPWGLMDGSSGYGYGGAGMTALADYSSLLGTGANTGIGGGLLGNSGMFDNVPIGLGGDTTFASMGAPGGSLGGGAGGMSGMDIASAGIAGLQTLANIWGSFQAQKMAKKQFKFTKQMTRTNLANQVKSYNTALADRARSRGFMEGQSQEMIDAYVRDNSLHTSAKGHQTTGSTPTPSTGGSIDRFRDLAAVAAARNAATRGSPQNDDDTPSSGG